MTSEEKPSRPRNSSPAELGRRIREAIQVLGTQADAAKTLGVSLSQLRRYMDGDNEPTFGFIMALAATTHVEYNWLATGNDEIVSVTSKLIDRPENKSDSGYVYVPRYDVMASAGPGALIEDENIVDYMAFKEDWIRKRLRARPEDLALIEAEGDSMLPTIQPGDLLLVDRSVVKLRDDAIYIIGIHDSLQVKRLQRFFNGAIEVNSDNDRYYAKHTLSEDDAANLRIAGRVRWIARMI